MPKPYPEEFRQDVVRVARNRDPGVTVEQVATDFGVHPMTLWKWMRRADIDDGAKPGTTSQESAQLQEARRRIKLLEQENEVLRRPRPICHRRICREKDLPARERAGRGRGARHGDVPGAQARQTALPPLA
ncbi:transposase [Streptomyces sp. ET3-23]|uniref:transposase n=1 Tax=Streptomyces sp. ET3-23 TaxID=2885643 RepID=UPI001D11790E|nr:transposase [Streptomyces sp. ET3-23]MCC2281018.1 transposase [Streptomyces sp. ET3-23]